MMLWGDSWRDLYLVHLASCSSGENLLTQVSSTSLDVFWIFVFFSTLYQIHKFIALVYVDMRKLVLYH